MPDLPSIVDLSLSELRALEKALPGEIKRREKTEKAALLAELQAMARAKGFELESLFGRRSSKATYS